MEELKIIRFENNTKLIGIIIYQDDHYTDIEFPMEMCMEMGDDNKMNLYLLKWSPYSDDEVIRFSTINIMDVTNPIELLVDHYYEKINSIYKDVHKSDNDPVEYYGDDEDEYFISLLNVDKKDDDTEH